MTRQSYYKDSRRDSYFLEYVGRVHARGNDGYTTGVQLVLLVSLR